MSDDNAQPKDRVNYLRSTSEALFKYINDIIDGNSDASEEYRKIVADRLLAYTEKYKAKRRPSATALNQKMLPDLLSVADLNIADMYRLMGKNLEWPSDEAKTFSERCAELSAQQLDRVELIVDELVPEICVEPWLTDALTIEKIYFLSLSQNPFDGKKKALQKTGIRTLQTLSNSHTKVSFDIMDLPDIAEYFHVSVHWLLMSRQPITALCATSRIELLCDKFMFIEPATRNHLCNAMLHVDVKQN